MTQTTSRPKRWLENKKHLGAHLADEHFISMLQGVVRRTETPPFFIPVRPRPYFSWMNRLKQAIDVLRNKADALYWPEDFIDPLTKE